MPVLKWFTLYKNLILHSKKICQRFNLKFTTLSVSGPVWSHLAIFFLYKICLIKFKSVSVVSKLILTSLSNKCECFDVPKQQLTYVSIKKYIHETVKCVLLKSQCFIFYSPRCQFQINIINWKRISFFFLKNYKLT